MRAAAKGWCGQCVPLLRLQEHSVIVRVGGSVAAVLCTCSTSHTALGLLVDRACPWPRNAPKYAGPECAAVVCVCVRGAAPSCAMRPVVCPVCVLLRGCGRVFKRGICVAACACERAAGETAHRMLCL